MPTPIAASGTHGRRGPAGWAGPEDNEELVDHMVLAHRAHWSSGVVAAFMADGKVTTTAVSTTSRTRSRARTSKAEPEPP